MNRSVNGSGAGAWLLWEATKPRAVRKGEARSPARRIAESCTQPYRRVGRYGPKAPGLAPKSIGGTAPSWLWPLGSGPMPTHRTFTEEHEQMKAHRNSKRSVRRRQRAKIRSGGKSACFVYGLKDESGSIRYVGQTRLALSSRLRFHQKSASPTGSPVQRWMVDNSPEIVMLDNEGVWDVCEILWIERLRIAGEPLLNVHRGGQDSGQKTAR